MTSTSRNSTGIRATPLATAVALAAAGAFSMGSNAPSSAASTSRVNGTTLAGGKSVFHNERRRKAEEAGMAGGADSLSYASISVTSTTMSQSSVSEVKAAADLESAYRKLSSFRGLRAGWGGTGSQCIDEVSIQTAYNLLCRPPFLLRAPDIVPTLDGGVQFEAETDAGYFEVELFQGSLHLYTEVKGADAYESADANWDEVAAAYCRIAGPKSPNA